MNELQKLLRDLMQSKEELDGLIKNKSICAAHPMLIKQLDKIEDSMNRKFSKVFKKLDNLEDEKIEEKAEKRVLEKQDTKKSENRKIWKERSIGAFFTIVILLIVYITPL